MHRMSLIIAALAILCSSAVAAERLRFWNLTTVTIAELRLAPAGTSQWGPNQCRNDADGTVDPDERLTLNGLEPGRYDAKLTDKAGRTCVVRNVEVKVGGRYAFSIADSDLTDCTK